MKGFYEQHRDDCQFPACWNVTNDQMPPHFHSSLEFIYVTDGILRSVLNGKIYDIQENQLLIVPSYNVHHFMTEKSSKSIVVLVPLSFIPLYRNILYKKTFSQCLLDLSGEENNEIFHCIDMLRQQKKYSPEVIKGYIYVMLGLIIDKTGLTDDDKNENDHLIKDILAFLEDHYLSSITLDSIAMHFGYSKSRFSHIFNNFFGCSISEYLNSLRCQKAADLLSEHSMSVTDAAMGSGFDSMRTFYRSFKHCFGVTPSQYIKK